MTAMWCASYAMTATPREQHAWVSLVFSIQNTARTRNVLLDYCTRIRYITGVGCACASQGIKELSHGAH